MIPNKNIEISDSIIYKSFVFFKDKIEGKKSINISSIISKYEHIEFIVILKWIKKITINNNCISETGGEVC